MRSLPQSEGPGNSNLVTFMLRSMLQYTNKVDCNFQAGHQNSKGLAKAPTQTVLHMYMAVSVADDNPKGMFD